MNNETRQLILQAQAGNVQAFHDLVALYDGKIMSLALQLTRNQMDAEDLYQEVFLKAYKKINQFRFESEFYTWLYRITVNTALNLKRKLAYLPFRDADPDFPEDYQEWVSDQSFAADQSAEIRSAVKQATLALPAKQRVVFLLKHMQNLKIREIAAIMGITEGTVKRYLFRAVEKLRKELKEFRYAVSENS